MTYIACFRDREQTLANVGQQAAPAEEAGRGATRYPRLATVATLATPVTVSTPVVATTSAVTTTSAVDALPTIVTASSTVDAAPMPVPPSALLSTRWLPQWLVSAAPRWRPSLWPHLLEAELELAANSAVAPLVEEVKPSVSPDGGQRSLHRPTAARWSSLSPLRPHPPPPTPSTSTPPQLPRSPQPLLAPPSTCRPPVEAVETYGEAPAGSRAWQRRIVACGCCPPSLRLRPSVARMR